MKLYDSEMRRRPAWTTAAVVAATFGGAAAVALGQTDDAPLRFVEVTARAGIDFVHFSGRSAEKHMPETMGGGVVWQDFDGDGRGDLYLVDSGVFEDVAPLSSPGPGAGTNVYYRAAAGGRYERRDVGAGDRGFGQGAAAGDFDNDGFADLYVTNYGADALYRNNGDGTFTDVTAAYGLGDPRWGTSAAWSDLDLDGFPELYVANYLVYSQANARVCGDVARGLRGYCTPDLFEGVSDILYRNLGGAGFEDIAAAAGVGDAVDGKGLGVTIADLDRDDLPDIYVANDATRNFVFMNRGGLRFEDIGLMSGAGLSVQGLPQSGMGVDIADLDGDGLPEIGVTNYEQQPVNMYRSLAPGFFSEDSFSVGIGGPTALMLGFGIVFVDADGDADADVVIANGHALDTDDQYPQGNQAFRNLRHERWLAGVPLHSGPLMEDVSARAGPALNALRVSRGLAAGDLDGDGWPDLIVTNIDAAPQLLRNDSPRNARRLVLRLRGRRASRDGFGTRVTVTTGDDESRFVQYLDTRSSTSYVSQSVNELYVGLGTAERADLRVHWPGGHDESVGVVDAGQILLIREGRGIVAARRLEIPHP